MSAKFPPFQINTVYQPSEYLNYQAPKLPPAGLELEFIYGSSRKGCKGNLLHVTNDGKVAYPSAACGVVYDLQKNSQNIFRKHNDDVKCMAMHPNGTIFATGEMGGDDVVHVWNSSSCKGLATIKTYKWFKAGGVIALAFSNDGSMLAAVGGNPLDSTLLVFDWEKGSLIAKTACATKRTFALKFSPIDNTLVWTGKNAIKFFEIANGNIHVRKGITSGIGELQSFYNICFGLTDGNTYIGTKDGHMYIFKQNKIIGKKEIHDGSVVASYQTKNGFVTGGKDGKVKIWKFDARARIGFSLVSEFDIGYAVGSVAPNGNGSLIYTWGHYNTDFGVIDVNSGNFTALNTGHYGKSVKTELWGLDVIPHTNLFFTAGDDGRIIMFNKDSRQAIAQVRHKNLDLRSVACSPDGTFVAAASSRGALVVYQVDDMVSKDPKPVVEIKCGREEIRVMRYSPSGKFLAVGSGNNKIYILDATKGHKRIGDLEGHTSFITGLDWSVDEKNLQSTSGDYELLYWSLSTEERITRQTSMRDTAWATQTCALGWTVRGVWNGYKDGSEINRVATHYDSNLLAAVDDFGDVNVFRYPTMTNNPLKSSYIGHCSHTTNCCFSSDGKHLLTLGGGDLTVFQWAIRRKNSLQNIESNMNREERRSKLSGTIQELSEPQQTVQRPTGRVHPLYQTSNSHYGSKPQNEVTKHTQWRGINGNFTKGFTGGQMYANYSLNTTSTRNRVLRD